MITDYDSLKQAIADWLGRADLTAQIPTFIQFAEARINKDLRVLEMQSEYVGTVNQVSKAMTVPDGVLEMQSVEIVVAGRYYQVNPLPPSQLNFRDEVTGVPLGYVRVEDQLYLIGGNIPQTAPGEPSQDVTYRLTYFAKIPALTGVGTITEVPGGGVITSAPNTSNWLLQKEPGAYLYASLIEASPYLQDDQRTLVWVEQYKSIIMGMQIQDDNARYGNAPSMKPMWCYP